MPIISAQLVRSASTLDAGVLVEVAGAGAVVAVARATSGVGVLATVGVGVTVTAASLTLVLRGVGEASSVSGFSLPHAAVAKLRRTASKKAADGSVAHLLCGFIV